MLKGIFTDENMDYFNGTQAIEFIRKLEKIKNYRKTQIVSMTCHENTKITDYIVEKGADYVLLKPLTKNMVLNIFKKIGFINNINKSARGNSGKF